MRTERTWDRRLPPLGWVLRVAWDENSAKLLHGSGVVWREPLLVEGVWSEEFEKFEPQQSMNLFGSCVVVGDNDVLLCPSTATSEPLFFRMEHNVLIASNSQILLLGACGQRLVAGIRDYEALNWARTRGLEQYLTEIPVTQGQIIRFVHHNLKMDARGWRLREKPKPEPFLSFARYRDYVRSSLHGCIDNARSRARDNPLKIVSTQSRGYDSTAVNALLQPYAPDYAFTCKYSKVVGDYFRPGAARRGPSDDGSLIGKKLGFECMPLESDAEVADDALDVLFGAGVHNNEDRNLLPIFKWLQEPAILLTGMMGELWNTQQAMRAACFEMHADNLLKRGDLSGFGLNEVRLWRHVAHVPVPYIGAVQRVSIHAITESVEMKPWRLDSDYDRPIARRIGEEAGLDRTLFGQRKLGSTLIMPTPELPLNAARRAAYLEDLIAQGLLSRWQAPLLGRTQRYNNWVRWRNPNRYFSSRRRHPAFYYFSRAVERCTGKKPRFRTLLPRLAAEHYRYSCNEMAERYAWLLGNYSPGWI